MLFISGILPVREFVMVKVGVTGTIYRNFSQKIEENGKNGNPALRFALNVHPSGLRRAFDKAPLAR
jgi:hypothetical protein